MVFKFILFILLLASFADSQKLINLKTFQGNSITEIDAVGPYSLYVSASSDSKSRLSQIYVNSSNNQLISLCQLKMNKMNSNSGFLQPFRVMKSASIISNLTDIDMRFLTGFLYITTRRQMNDNSFYVYDVDQQQTIHFDETKPENCTLVFLNSNASMVPYQSSTINNWVQSENSSVFMYPGVPKNGIQKSYSQIFSNPVSTTDNMKFFSYIEPFSISTPIFYMKIHKGIQFAISPVYLNINGTATSFPTTTGFYMKPYNRPDEIVSINMASVKTFFGDSRKSLVGANMSLTEHILFCNICFSRQSDSWQMIHRCR
ncbi:hypothetical protein B9Z55_019417 [Caenorhabditis nigoni]|uniref:CUB-like domain-containing protein n=1 Tax=Caenorhabditis nigoni TaxID=1611254 RepID=A0A2G5TJ56_9PELO|nr:hypothetical protein B9Z55_019417 [Caenorhabditis nigoni]